jgi:hypothetical protein
MPQLFAIMQGAPIAFLQQLSGDILRRADVLEMLARVIVSRAQVETIWRRLPASERVTHVMLLAVSRTPMLQYMPVDLFVERVHASTFDDVQVSAALKDTFCKHVAGVNYRIAFEVYRVYAPPSARAPMLWSRDELLRMGCLVRYASPIDVARISLTEVDIHVVRAWAAGDYAPTMARLLVTTAIQVCCTFVRAHNGQALTQLRNMTITDALEMMPPSLTAGLATSTILYYLPDKSVSNA